MFIINFFWVWLFQLRHIQFNSRYKQYLPHLLDQINESLIGWLGRVINRHVCTDWTTILCILFEQACCILPFNLYSLRWQSFILYRNISDSNYKMLHLCNIVTHVGSNLKLSSPSSGLYPLDLNNYLHSIQQMREWKRERYLFHQ